MTPTYDPHDDDRPATENDTRLVAMDATARATRLLKLADALRALANVPALRSADDCDLCAEAADELTQLAGGAKE